MKLHPETGSPKRTESSTTLIHSTKEIQRSSSAENMWSFIKLSPHYAEGMALFPDKSYYVYILVHWSLSILAA